MDCHTKIDWSDNEVLKLYQPMNARSNLSGLELIKFFNSYSSKKIDNYKREDFLRLILLLPHPSSSKLLFHDYLSSKTVDDAKETVARKSLFSRVQKNCLNVTFESYVQKNYEKSASLTENDKSLRIIAGVLALICFRSVGKSANVVKKCLEENAKNLIKELFPNIDYDGEIPVASDAFLEILQYFCCKSVAKVKNFLIFIIAIYVKEKKKEPNADVALINILEKCVLHGIRLHRMTEIKLLEQVSDIYNLEMRVIIGLMNPPSGIASLLTRLDAVQINRESMSAREFYVKYMANKAEIAWPWARLINEDYFDGFEPRGYADRCCKLAAIAIRTNPEILEIDNLMKFTAIISTWDLYAKGMDVNFRHLQSRPQTENAGLNYLLTGL